MAQLFIGQLPFSKFFPDDLLNLFRPYGIIIAHQLHIRQGNAFVTYATTEEADAAIRSLHGQCALGTRSQPIQVMYSKGTRLISPFGLQHRSICLARNKDRQKGSEGQAMSSGSGSSAVVAADAGVIAPHHANNGQSNDSISLNDGSCISLNPLHGFFYTAAAAAVVDDVSGPSNRSTGTAADSSHLSRGQSDVSYDDDHRSGVNGILPSNIASPPSLNVSAAGGVKSAAYTHSHGGLPAPQYSAQLYAPGAVGSDSALYSRGMQWAAAPPTLMLSASTAAANGGQSVSHSLPSPPSRAATPPTSAPLSVAGSLGGYSYVMVQPQQQQQQAPPPPPSFGAAFNLPVCYVVPTAGAPVYGPPQPQAALMNGSGGAFYAPFGGPAVSQVPMAFVQMQPM